MQTTLIKTLCMGFATVVLAACARQEGGIRTPTSQTTTTSGTTGDTTGVSTAQGVGSPGDPNGASPRRSGVTVTSGAPASPMEGACPEGHPSLGARDLSSCTSSCRGLDPTVPPTSACTSSYDRCIIECRQSYAQDRQ